MNTLVAAMLLLLVSPAFAAAAPLLLSIVPATQTVPAPGQTVFVDVTISGVDSASLVGAFDLDIAFLPSVLQPVGVTFGPSLGDAALGEVLTDFTFSPGLVDFAAVSLLSDTDLIALQLASFNLATLAFTTVGGGTTPLIFTQTVVDDPSGGKLDTEAATGNVTVIPEPGSLWLLGSSLSALIGVRRFGRARAGVASSR